MTIEDESAEPSRTNNVLFSLKVRVKKDVIILAAENNSESKNYPEMLDLLSDTKMRNK